MVHCSDAARRYDPQPSVTIGAVDVVGGTGFRCRVVRDSIDHPAPRDRPAARVASGDLQSTVSGGSSDELRRLAESFNDMVRKIRERDTRTAERKAEIGKRPRTGRPHRGTLARHDGTRLGFYSAARLEFASALREPIHRSHPGIRQRGNYRQGTRRARSPRGPVRDPALTHSRGRAGVQRGFPRSYCAAVSGTRTASIAISKRWYRICSITSRCAAMWSTSAMSRNA